MKVKYENTMDYMIERKIKFHIARVKWLIREEGYSVEDAIKEVRSSSTFGESIWERIRREVTEGIGE